MQARLLLILPSAEGSFPPSPPAQAGGAPNASNIRPSKGTQNKTAIDLKGNGKGSARLLLTSERTEAKFWPAAAQPALLHDKAILVSAQHPDH